MLNLINLRVVDYMRLVAQHGSFIFLLVLTLLSKRTSRVSTPL